jgi:hypothetical protein
MIFLGSILAAGFHAAGLSGCAEAPLAGTVPTEAPAWVNSGSGVFNLQGKDALFGVGIAQGIRNRALQVTAADDRARAEVAKLTFHHLSRLGTDLETSKSLAKAGLAHAIIYDHWKDPSSGTMFSLCRLDLEFLDRLVSAQGLAVQARQPAAAMSLAPADAGPARISAPSSSPATRVQAAANPPGLSKEDLEQLVKAAVAGAMQAQAQTPKPEARPARAGSDVDEPPAKRAERPDDFALVVGIEAYQDKDLPKADYAERDAEAAARHFLALGVPRRNLKLLKGSDATGGRLKGYLESWLPKNVSGDSRVYFYFSGHGAPNPESGDAYLLPWDGNPEFLDASAAPLKSVYSSLGRLKAREVLVALDACFSGTGGRSVIQKGTRPLVAVRTEEPAEARNLTVIAASRANEVTGSLDEEGHGIFTYYLLKGLKEGARDSSSLCGYLKPKVADAAARQNRTQTPVCRGESLSFE